MNDDVRFDARVRGALQDLPLPSDPATGQALREVLGRSGRRTATIWVPIAAAAAVAAILVVLVPLLPTDHRDDTDPAPPIAPPTAQVEGTWGRDVRGADDSSWNGSWRMTLGDKEVLVFRAPAGAGNVSDGAAYDVTGGQLRVSAFVNSVCPEMPAGIYRWSRSGTGLTLVAVSEPCAVREDLLTGSWAQVP